MCPSMNITKYLKTLIILTAGWLTLLPAELLACPFCNAVSQTLRQEMAAMDSVVIAISTQDASERDAETGKLMMKVVQVLKGGDLVQVGDELEAIYYGDVTKGRRLTCQLATVTFTAIVTTWLS